MVVVVGLVEVAQKERRLVGRRTRTRTSASFASSVPPVGASAAISWQTSATTAILRMAGGFAAPRRALPSAC